MTNRLLYRRRFVFVCVQLPLSFLDMRNKGDLWVETYIFVKISLFGVIIVLSII